ncbi:MAG: HAD-IIB family hydrolase [Spirochaetaceae bacterium]|nr:HAD-IIB family hydrolase [Spirochaetaceae bacterium]
MKPILEMTEEEAAKIRYVLTDIDDTLTQDGKLRPDTYKMLWELKEAGLAVIPLTGRPAGWCDLIARTWPVDGVVGESGAFAFWETAENGGKRTLKSLYHKTASSKDHPILKKIQKRALAEFPGIRIAKDQFSRLFDLSFDFAEEDPVLPLATVEKIKEMAVSEGATVQVSSLHINIWIGSYNKASMAEYFLEQRFAWKSGSEDDSVFYVGDSPNDESMFARFPMTCAVANIRHYLKQIKAYPAFVSSKEYGEGFVEAARVLLDKRRAFCLL